MARVDAQESSCLLLLLAIGDWLAVPIAIGAVPVILTHALLHCMATVLCERDNVLEPDQASCSRPPGNVQPAMTYSLLGGVQRQQKR